MPNDGPPQTLIELLLHQRIVAVSETEDGWLVLVLDSGHEVRLLSPAVVVHPLTH